MSNEELKAQIMNYDKETIVNSISAVLDKDKIEELIKHMDDQMNVSIFMIHQQENEILSSDEKKQETETETENENEDDPELAANVEYMKKYGFRPSWQNIDRKQVKKMIDGNKRNYVIIDVRTKQFDYNGGNIKGSINIASNIFEMKIHKTVMKYIDYDNFIIHCMYSQMRGPTIANIYYNALQELCKNYKNGEENPTFQLTKLNKIYGKIDDKLYEKLYNQNIFLLEEGFSGWLNSCIHSSFDMAKYVENFDQNTWELDDDKLVHRLDWNANDQITQNDASSDSDS